ncbi:PilW family protein [Noviherbaspirillum sp. Root189]|uniref:PilW family protein n=1 Tax=Noviherbaspirillum sp. Root189 TaxID=1736487 RepID=UPI0009EBF5A1|nr:PilW family protein [Noviherbaspirillum sp. Root189]
MKTSARYRMKPRSTRPFPPFKRERGLSLVELMIAITLGLVLVAGVTTLISQQSSTSRELNNTSRQIENGRYAIQVLRDDIELAGYYGAYFNIALDFPVAGASATLPDPCAASVAELDAALPVAIQGYDSPTTVPTALAACLADANHLSGTDILVIRRADTNVTTLDPSGAGAEAGQAYIQAGLDTSKVFKRQVGIGPDTSEPRVFTLKKMDGAVADLHRFFVHIYYVSPCNKPATGTTCSGASDDNGNPIPTLKRLALGVSAGSTAFINTPLVEGIQNVQFDYGIDKDNDGAPDYYTTGTYAQDGSTELVATDWWNVMTVRAHILSRNPDASGGYTDDKTYSLGLEGNVGPFDDRYKRHVFSETIRAVNPSGRRAQ